MVDPQSVKCKTLNISLSYYQCVFTLRPGMLCLEELGRHRYMPGRLQKLTQVTAELVNFMAITRSRGSSLCFWPTVDWGVLSFYVPVSTVLKACLSVCGMHREKEQLYPEAPAFRRHGLNEHHSILCSKAC